MTDPTGTIAQLLHVFVVAIGIVAIALHIVTIFNQSKIYKTLSTLFDALTGYIKRNDERIARIDAQGGEGNDARVKAILDANKADIERVMDAIRQIKSG